MSVKNQNRYHLTYFRDLNSYKSEYNPLRLCKTSCRIWPATRFYRSMKLTFSICQQNQFSVNVFAFSLGTKR